VQEAIHQAHREFVDDGSIRFGETRKPGQGGLHLVPPDRFRGLSEDRDIDRRRGAQRSDHAFRLPSNPVLDPSERVRGWGTLTPRCEAVQVPQVHAREPATARIHVPRKTEVDEPDRPTVASTNGGAEGLRGDERALDRRRGDHDVGFGEDLPEIRERDGFPTETLRKLAGPRGIPIQNPDFGARPEILCGDSCHLPGPDEHNDSILDGYDGLEESNGSVARGRVAGGGAGTPADLGGDSGRVMKQIRQRSVRRGPGRSPQRGVPDLRRHLVLAFCEGIQTAGDPNEMRRRIEVFEDIQDRLVLGDAKSPANGFRGPLWGLRKSVHLDSVACRQEDEVGPRWSMSARFPQGSIRGFAEQTLPRVEARSAMVCTDDEEVGRNGGREPLKVMRRTERLAIHRPRERSDPMKI
jgi:hypothetical protein